MEIIKQNKHFTFSMTVISSTAEVLDPVRAKLTPVRRLSVDDSLVASHLHNTLTKQTLDDKADNYIDIFMLHSYRPMLQL